MSTPPGSAVLARTSLMRQINWKTTQQGASRNEGHHQRRTGKTILTRTRLTESMSVAPTTIARMFEGLDDAALVSTIAAEARASAIADARKFGAIAELERRRNTAEYANWACDGWDTAAAELAAALNISHGRACGEMDLAVTLRDRLPKVAALFLAGNLTARRVWLI